MHAESAHKGGLIFDFAKVDALRRTHSLKYTHIQGHFPLFFSNCPIHLANVPLLSDLSLTYKRTLVEFFLPFRPSLCGGTRVVRKSREMKFQALIVCCVAAAVAAAGNKGFEKCPKVLGKYPFDADKVNNAVPLMLSYISCYSSHSDNESLVQKF
jgi:hypothetical protein